MQACASDVHGSGVLECPAAETKATGCASQVIAPPAVAKRYGDGDCLWVLRGSKRVRSIQEMFELFVNPEFFQQQVKQRRRPAEALGTTGDSIERSPSAFPSPFQRVCRALARRSLEGFHYSWCESDTHVAWFPFHVDPPVQPLFRPQTACSPHAHFNERAYPEIAECKRNALEMSRRVPSCSVDGK